MRTALRAGTLALVLVLTGCSAPAVILTIAPITSPATQSAPTMTPASTTSPSPTPPVKPTTATGWAKAIRQPKTYKIVTITEKNDPNNSIGRPGKYTDAAALFDKRVRCESKLDITCGAKIEIYEDADAAKARAAYLDGIMKAAPILGSEWHELAGPVLLRVSGKLRPSWAKAYRQAFRTIADR